MSTENEKPANLVTAQAQEEPEDEEEAGSSATRNRSGRSLDDYIKVMAALREGGRPLLSW
jgi:hypothetical protein